MTSAPDVSIIIPVYNAAATLGRCLDSVSAQSHTRWQLLLVDDGSTDASGDMCDARAAADPRIQAVHKPNGGVSTARNAALDLARGTYVTFIDADDWIEPGYLATLLGAVGDADMAVGGFTIEGADLDYDRTETMPDALLQGLELRQLLDRCITYSQFSSPWGNLYRRDIIEQGSPLRFDYRLSNGEDMVWNYGYLTRIRSMRGVPQRMYHYWCGHGGGLSASDGSNSAQYPILIDTLTRLLDTLHARLGTDAGTIKLRLLPRFVLRELEWLIHGTMPVTERHRLTRRLWRFLGMHPQLRAQVRSSMPGGLTGRLTAPLMHLPCGTAYVTARRIIGKGRALAAREGK